MKPDGSDLNKRYKRNYSIPDEIVVTDEMILKHWELEKQLARDLLASTPGERWETFERCYTRLYTELSWLNHDTENSSNVERGEFEKWALLLGSSPLKIYEVGSGKGALLSFLAELKHECKGSEVTHERGEKWASPRVKLDWGLTDGVHLDEFEPAGSYDVVISNQVIEHLHPDDVPAHMRSAYAILRNGGKYVFNTPHVFAGPDDISKIFGTARSEGMHLKEYTYRELVDLSRGANFSEVYYVGFPVIISRVLSRFGFGTPRVFEKTGKIYLKLLLFVEANLNIFPNNRFRHVLAAVLHKTKLFNRNIFLAVVKG